MMRTNRWRMLPLCLLVLSGALIASATPLPRERPLVTRAPSSLAPTHVGNQSLDEVIYSENWESGTLNGWTPRDLTAIPAMWHLDDNTAHGGSGTSWWMADTTLGGYRNDWYQGLDSPPITLPAGAPTLSFYHRYSVETPGGEPAGYNAWDGMNLRISTDNGATWSVVPSAVLTPAYDRTSLYSFGFQHGEGTGIPGWTGANTTWHLQAANLTAWAGQTVKLRWAFASDPGFSTEDNAAMFAWMIDAIRVYSGTDTVFSDDANSAAGWTPVNLRPVGGNLWRLATDNTSPTGPQIVVTNDAADNLYDTRMNSVLESPLIDISAYSGGTLTADFYVSGVVQGEGFPDADYWGIEVSADSGHSWCAVSNPTCAPGGDNFVYTSAPTTWLLFSDFSQASIDVSALLGTTDALMFRFTFQSNGDNDVAVGPRFDGFSLDFSASFPNDVSCYSLQVRYPNVVDRPFQIKAYFRNVGTSAVNDVQTWWRHSTLPNWIPFLGRLSLQPDEEARRDTFVFVDSPGVYTFWARSGLANDANAANDTATAVNVDVMPGTSQFEIGYDNRTARFRYAFATNAGPLVHFTPISDGTVQDAYNVSALSVLFDEQPADYNVTLHLYDGATAPGTEFYSATVPVLMNETAPTWKQIDLSAVSELQGRTTDFWAWIEVLDSAAGERWPQVVGANAEPWDDVHFYTWTGGTDPINESSAFYLIHAVIDDLSGVRDVTTTVPTRFSLEQNYPNPFNPTTEIRYNVPRAERLTLTVFNLMGQQVATLVDGMTQPGSYVVDFNGANLSTGVYIYRLESASFTETRKMLLMK